MAGTCKSVHLKRFPLICIPCYKAVSDSLCVTIKWSYLQLLAGLLESTLPLQSSSASQLELNVFCLRAVISWCHFPMPKTSTFTSMTEQRRPPPGAAQPDVAGKPPGPTCAASHGGPAVPPMGKCQHGAHPHQGPTGSSVQPWLWDGRAVSCEHSQKWRHDLRQLSGHEGTPASQLGWGSCSSRKAFKLEAGLCLLWLLWQIRAIPANLSICSQFARPLRLPSSAQHSHPTWQLFPDRCSFIPTRPCNCNWKRKFLPFFHWEQRVTSTSAQYLGRFYLSSRFAELAVNTCMQLATAVTCNWLLPLQVRFSLPLPKETPGASPRTRLQVAWALLGEVDVNSWQIGGFEDSWDKLMWEKVPAFYLHRSPALQEKYILGLENL